MPKLLLYYCLISAGLLCCSSKQTKQPNQKPLITVVETDSVIAGQIEYIKKYRELAVEEMLKSDIPASVKLAQGLLETTHGTSILATQGNNHFGIKCKVDWKGDVMYADDDAKGECFRKYPSPIHSYQDHSVFLKHHRLHFYDKLFELPIDDYKGWCYGLQECGYATAVTYARSLVRLIERYNLYELDAYHLKSKREIPTYQEVNTFGEAVIVEPVQKSKISCVHIVRKGETLANIAKIYNLTVEQIVQLNSFSEKDTLSIGQAIKLN